MITHTHPPPFLPSSLHLHTLTTEGLLCPLHYLPRRVAAEVSSRMLGLAVGALVEAAGIDRDNLH